MRRAFEQLPGREASCDTDDRADLPEHIPDPVHATNVRQPLSMRSPRKNKIGILGHTGKAEINLARPKRSLAETAYGADAPGTYQR